MTEPSVSRQRPGDRSAGHSCALRIGGHPARGGSRRALRRRQAAGPLGRADGGSASRANLSRRSRRGGRGPPAMRVARHSKPPARASSSHADGMGASLACGVARGDARGWVIALADMPWCVSTPCRGRRGDRRRRHRRAPFFAASAGIRRLRQACGAALAALPATTARGGRRRTGMIAHRRRRPGVVRDVDTPERFVGRQREPGLAVGVAEPVGLQAPPGAQLRGFERREIR